MDYQLLKAIANVLHTLDHQEQHEEAVYELIRIQLVHCPDFWSTTGDGQLLRHLYHALHPTEYLNFQKAKLYATLLDNLVTRRDP